MIFLKIIFWHGEIFTRVCDKRCGLAIYIEKYLKAKEELWKLKYFTMQKYINLQINPLKKKKKPKSFKIL
jgi:hypothetical protein